MKSTTGMQCLFAIHVLHAGISFAQPMSYNVMGKRAPPGTAFKCPDGGAAKGQNRGDGATPYSLSVFQLEVGCDGNANKYPYADNKKEGSANFGQYKNNWDNIRTHCCKLDPRLCGTAADYNNGAILNSEPDLATQCQNQQVTDLGKDRFACTQRGGSTCTAADTAAYNGATDAIQGTGVNGDGTQPNPKPSPINPGPVKPNPSQPGPITQPSTPVTKPGAVTNPSGTDIYGSDVCGYGGGPFKGCKTQQEACDHIKTNGQPLPLECGGSANAAGPSQNQNAPAQNANSNQPAQQNSGTDIYGSDVCGYGGGPFKRCKTQQEACDHIKKNGQPLPAECSGSSTTPTTNPTDTKTPNQAAQQQNAGPSPAPYTAQAAPKQLKEDKAVVTPNQGASDQAAKDQAAKDQAAKDQAAKSKPAQGQSTQNQPTQKQPAANNGKAQNQPASNGGSDADAAWAPLSPQKRDG